MKRNRSRRVTVAQGNDLDQVELSELVLLILGRYKLQVGEAVLVALDGGDQRRDALPWICDFAVAR